MYYNLLALQSYGTSIFFFFFCAHDFRSHCWYFQEVIFRNIPYIPNYVKTDEKKESYTTPVFAKIDLVFSTYWNLIS